MKAIKHLIPKMILPIIVVLIIVGIIIRGPDIKTRTFVLQNDHPQDAINVVREFSDSSVQLVEILPVKKEAGLVFITIRYIEK